jgi:fructosamine-3-kinase
VTTVESLLAGDGPGVQMTTLDDGTEVVVKSGEPSAIAAESAGLRWLAEPGAVAVPEVLGTTEGRMVSTRVPSGRADAATAERFGRELAALHAAGAPAFGSPPPGGPVHAWIGEARMVNETGDDWPSWYAGHRVLPYARQARDQGTFSADDVALVERACERFDAPPEPPARLHGDLWTGNVMWDGDRAWVIDPAAHGGHRETDLAMLALFGAPQLETVLAAYDEAAPLADGWRDRVGLHQLFPLLVHTVLFGGGYAAQALAVCENFRPS